MLLEVKKIEKNFGTRAILKQGSLELRTGETVGIFGRNGAGKSTLMKILFGTMRANASSLYIDSIPFNPSTNIAGKLIAYLPQHSFLPRGLKVRDLIPLIISDGERQNQVFYSPGVASFDNQRIGSLSLGILKYLEFLLLAYLDHPFLMLDEPFSMIDPLYHEIIKKVILSLRASKGILVTDHYYDTVWDVTTRNYVLVDGSLSLIKAKDDLSTYGYLPGRK
ncbi:ATP-binding cassette domain-containing protein [Spirosoma endbachense]|uniref:ATP-binding cassette domain-containing protein n=1 Tax=Spirosoma endbachense TaxID=2666025 RepID=A0A6P1VTF5_9BACT|nr:ATP-binding cassette domain-containing protein [Spirosoma endbachense]QHV95698.1 ATP-binding cassette domain-containing protein [Spirosoma endbachense]